MYDDVLIEAAAEADLQLRGNLGASAPSIASAVETWLDDAFAGVSLAEIFTRSDAFPMLLFPWWADVSTGVPDPQLHRMLSYSTMNGYLYIRLIDNLMDRDAPAGVGLLPALSFFHHEFIEPYRSLFGARHPFWSDFRTVWLETAEATFRDAALEEIDRSTFERISARKTGAAKIPVAAVCHFRRSPHLQPGWDDLVDAFGRWHQMHNDIFSWKKDADHDIVTYFLSEARRRRPEGDIAGWLVDEGFSWGINVLAQFMAELRRIAHGLEADEVLVYLDHREELLQEQVAEVRSGLAAVSHVRDVVRG